MFKGEPRVTLKFPWSEVAIMAIMLMIMIRLAFKKQVKTAASGKHNTNETPNKAQYKP